METITVTTTWGATLLTPKDDLSLTPALVANRVLEPALTNYLLKTVQPGWTCVDVGAHLGYFSVLMGTAMKGFGHVWALEPNPRIYAFLEANLKKLTCHTLPLEIAAYSQGRPKISLRLECCLTYTGNSSIHRHTKEYATRFPGDRSKECTVYCSTLDSLLCEEFVDAPNLIKLDIEGGEYHAFLGMKNLLADRKVGQVVFEWNRLMLQEDTEPFAALLADYRRAGWRYHLLSDEGELIPTELERITQSEFEAAVVMK